MKKNKFKKNLKLDELIKIYSKLLLDNNIKSAYLDVLIVLENILHISRTHILLNNDIVLSESQFKLFRKYLNKRIAHKPISQILGFSYFYDIKFIINKNVLQPRPETENMITEIQNIIIKDNTLHTKKHINILDLGTGSGNIGITLLKNIKNCSVDMIDISRKALRIAKLNAVIHTTDYNIMQNNLLDNISFNYDIIVANLPYVPLKYSINKDAKYEPKRAIFTKNNGIYLYQKMFNYLNKTPKPLFLLLESLPNNQHQLIQVANKNGYILYNISGYVSVFKLLKS